MMTDVGLLMEKFDALEDIFSRYGRLTNSLFAADLELTDETDLIFAERESLIEQMKILRPQINELISMQAPDKAEAIRQMLAGQTITHGFTEDVRAVQSKVINLRSLQGDIVKKDGENQIRFRRKYDEVREELEKLQNDKKKLNFYHNARPEVKGGRFDNQS